MTAIQFNRATQALSTAIILAVSLALCGCMSPRGGGATSDVAAYEKIIASPLRTEEDRQADETRKPLEFLQFTQVQSGMQVLDIFAGGGYTTQLLALAVGNNGVVWAQNNKSRPALEKRLSEHPQANIVPVITQLDDPVPQHAPKLDLITIIFNYHDIAYMPVDRSRMNHRLFDALKSGGHLVVVDHAARAGTGTADTKSLHRIDEQLVIDELKQAGFALDQASDFLRNPADPRQEAYFNMKIKSDKFALRFVKP